MLCALIAAGIFGTFAAFTATTQNTGNQVTAGTVKIDQHAGYTSLYNATGKKPGEDTTGCVRVTYAGSLPAAVKLYSSAAITNGSAFNLKVERGSGLSSPGASMSCTGFSASSTVYNASLAGFPSTFGTGSQAKSGASAWLQSDAVDYRFTITPNDDAAANAHTTVQSTSPHDFTWEARSYGAYPAGVLATSGLQSYWRLGETSGTTAYDTAPTGSTTGTYTNGPILGRPSLTNDASDGAAAFDNADDYVSLGDNYDFTGTVPFSAEIWARPDGTKLGDYQRLMGKRYSDGSGTHGWDIIGYPNNKVVVERWDAGGGFSGTSSTTTLAAGSRTHVVMTYDGSTLRIYINGVLESSSSSTLSMPNTPGNLTIGGPTFGGDLDDASLYNRALTVSEVKAHYDAGN